MKPIKKLVDSFQSMPLNGNGYLDSYKTIRQLFARLDFSCDQDIRAGACCVYAWMPTILKKLPSNEECLALRALLAESASKGSSIDLSLHTSALTGIHNSISGTSKFLHFARPEVFPIYDSNIASILAMPMSLNGRHYRDYFDAMHLAVEDVPLPSWYDAEIDSTAEDWTKMRRVEFALFLMGKALKQEFRDG